MPMSFALSAALFLLRRSLSERVETEDASGAAGIEHGADGVVVTPERSGKPLLDSDAPRAQIFSGNRARLGEIRSACDQFAKQTCAVRRAERWRFRSGPRISGTLRQLPSLAGRSNLRDLAASSLRSRAGSLAPNGLQPPRAPLLVVWVPFPVVHAD